MFFKVQPSTQLACSTFNCKQSRQCNL